MKRTCNGCKAEDQFRCDLGYEVEKRSMTGVWAGIQAWSKPLEECPKPKTNRQYVDMALGKIKGKKIL